MRPQHIYAEKIPENETANDVRIEIESETGTGTRPARIIVYYKDEIVALITGTVEFRPGADGGQYPCVVLKQQTVADT